MKVYRFISWFASTILLSTYVATSCNKSQRRTFSSFGLLWISWTFSNAKLNIRDLTNLDIFQTSREVEEDLKKRKTTKWIAWCLDNESNLRIISSNIEFRLRVQEFIELIRAAVKHATKAFLTYEKDQLKEIQKYISISNQYRH